jgi:hypothetical protein
MMDLLIAGTAEVSQRLKSVEVVVTRSSPSDRLDNRLERGVGIYTHRSMTNAVVRIRNGSDIRTLLSGKVLWEADFALFTISTADVTDLPSPHVTFEDFSRRVDWSLMQDTGSTDWTLTAQSRDLLKNISVQVASSLANEGLTIEFDEAL